MKAALAKVEQLGNTRGERTHARWEVASDDLREVARHESRMEWADARIDLERGKARLGSRGPEALREQLRHDENDLDLVGRLGAIAMDRAAVTQGRFNRRSNNARADRAYEAAFRDAGYGGAGDEPQAGRIAASQIRDALVAALDNWAACAPDEPRRAWVLSIARLADPSPQRDRLREPGAWSNKEQLAELTRTAMQAGPSVQLLVALGEQLQEIGGDAVPFLKQVQQAHPGDFWANFRLGEALRNQHSLEAIRYFQAAVAVDPRAAVAYNNLGITLSDNGRADEAAEAFGVALRIDPAYAPAHNNLGIALAAKGQANEAIGHYLEALRSEPDDPETHNNLGIALRDAGRTDEAIDHFLQALRIRPGYVEAHSNIGLAFAMKGQFDDAIEHYRQVLQTRENDGPTQNNLGIALVRKGRLSGAIEHYRRAVQIDPNDGPAHNNLGLALRDSGQFDDAIHHFQEVLRVNPDDRAARENLVIAIAEKQRLANVPRTAPSSRP